MITRKPGSMARIQFLSNKNMSNVAIGHAGVDQFASVTGGESDGAYLTLTRQSEQRSATPVRFDLLSFCIIRGNQDGITTVAFHINGVDGNQILTIPALSNALVQDTTNTDNVTSSDLYCIRVNQPVEATLEGGNPASVIRCTF